MKSRSSKAKRRARPARAPRRLRTASIPWPDCLAPEVIADTVIWEVSCFLREPLPRDYYGDLLIARAHRCFHENAHFRNLMLGGHCREWLRSFIRHWLAELLQSERPDLWVCLPPPFDAGHPLPDGRHPRINRRESYPRRKALRWSASRFRLARGESAITV